MKSSYPCVGPWADIHTLKYVLIMRSQGGFSLVKLNQNRTIGSCKYGILNSDIDNQSVYGLANNYKPQKIAFTKL